MATGATRRFCRLLQETILSRLILLELESSVQKQHNEDSQQANGLLSWPHTWGTGMETPVSANTLQKGGTGHLRGMWRSPPEQQGTLLLMKPFDRRGGLAQPGDHGSPPMPTPLQVCGNNPLKLSRISGNIPCPPSKSTLCLDLPRSLATLISSSVFGVDCPEGGSQSFPLPLVILTAQAWLDSVRRSRALHRCLSQQKRQALPLHTQDQHSRIHVRPVSNTTTGHFPGHLMKFAAAGCSKQHTKNKRGSRCVCVCVKHTTHLEIACLLLCWRKRKEKRKECDLEWVPSFALCCAATESATSNGPRSCLPGDKSPHHHHPPIAQPRPRMP